METNLTFRSDCSRSHASYCSGQSLSMGFVIRQFFESSGSKTNSLNDQCQKPNESYNCTSKKGLMYSSVAACIKLKNKAGVWAHLYSKCQRFSHVNFLSARSGLQSMHCAAGSLSALQETCASCHVQAQPLFPVCHFLNKRNFKYLRLHSRSKPYICNGGG